MSSQRAALMAGIRAALDEDAPRLVCADWFEEQGDKPERFPPLDAALDGEFRGR